MESVNGNVVVDPYSVPHTYINTYAYSRIHVYTEREQDTRCLWVRYLLWHLLIFAKPYAVGHINFSIGHIYFYTLAWLCLCCHLALIQLVCIRK